MCIFSQFSETCYLIFWCMFLKIDWKYTYKGGMLILNSEFWKLTENTNILAGAHCMNLQIHQFSDQSGPIFKRLDLGPGGMAGKHANCVRTAMYRYKLVDHRSTDRAVSAYWPMDLGQSIHNSYFHAMRAQNHMCIFSHYSSEYRSKIDWKSCYLAGSAHAWFRNFYLLRSESPPEKTPACRCFEFCADTTVWWAGSTAVAGSPILYGRLTVCRVWKSHSTHQTQSSVRRVRKLSHHKTWTILCARSLWCRSSPQPQHPPPLRPDFAEPVHAPEVLLK